MSLQDRIAALKERHTRLENQLNEEFSRPHSDEARIAEIKRQKLRIKDEIENHEQKVGAA